MNWPKDHLTRFEVARLVGARALQIALGAPILIKSELTSSIDLAKEEFKNKVIPITIKRKLPSGEKIIVDVKKGIDNWMKVHEGEI
ncbi:MAG: DNA-directed RNA polymerase subunit K [Candidatus Aenigmarchaeota archaeon]|nr:DNA-directed RNA polymerase subunit K [Candidatus Aenigmarchaeota archaeon]